MQRRVHVSLSGAGQGTENFFVCLCIVLVQRKVVPPDILKVLSAGVNIQIGTVVCKGDGPALCDAEDGGAAAGGRGRKFPLQGAESKALAAEGGAGSGKVSGKSDFQPAVFAG